MNDIAEFLLQLGCDPYFPDINGDTAFHYCVRGCNLKFLKSFHSAYGNRVFEVLVSPFIFQIVTGQLNVIVMNYNHRMLSYATGLLWPLLSVLFHLSRCQNNNHFNLVLTAAAESSDEKAYEILNILEWLHLSGVSIESHDANVSLKNICRHGVWLPTIRHYHMT